LARSTIDSDSLPKFGSGQVNREDARDALRGSCSGLAALAHLLHAVHEGDTILNERQKMCAVDPSPPGLRHIEELVFGTAEKPWTKGGL